MTGLNELVGRLQELQKSYIILAASAYISPIRHPDGPAPVRGAKVEVGADGDNAAVADEAA